MKICFSFLCNYLRKRTNNTCLGFCTSVTPFQIWTTNVVITSMQRVGFKAKPYGILGFLVDDEKVFAKLSQNILPKKEGRMRDGALGRE